MKRIWVSVTDDDGELVGRFAITSRQVEPFTSTGRPTNRLPAKLLVQSWIGEQVLAHVPDGCFPTNAHRWGTRRLRASRRLRAGFPTAR
jgi:hypothetical protein